METAEPSSITDRSQIEETDLSIILSNLTIEATEPERSSQPLARHIKVALLQPLATPSVLAACRNPSSALTSMTVCSSDGSVSTAPGDEYLDLTTLDKAWRKCVGKALPVSFITFDLGLPKPETSGVGEGERGNAFQRVYWDTSPPYKELAPCIHERDVMRLVITIATTARMRAEGELGFEVTYDEKDRASASSMALLRKQLQAIAGSRRPGLAGGQQA